MNTRGAPLVRPKALWQASGVRVVDCSHDLADPEAGLRLYAEAHVPGAVHAHLDNDLSGAKTGRNGRHPLPPAKQFVAWVARNGICATDDVVAYDRSGGMYAARLWWLLRWIGHRRVSVLDGGLQAWVAEGLPVTQERKTWQPHELMQFRTDDAMCVNSDFVVGNLSTRASIVVDARGVGRFAGIGETIDPRAGHIPGARNRPYTDNLGADGFFKPKAVLAAEWEKVLDTYTLAQMVAQCGSGVTACHNLLALDVAGLPGARLYPGSWSEWCSDAARPISTGAA